MRMNLAHASVGLTDRMHYTRLRMIGVSYNFLMM